MARIKFSGLVDSIRGSIGGTTFQSNKYGYTVKKKQLNVRPNTSRQNNRKLIMSIVSRSWRDLTGTQRTEWETWASSYPQYAKYNPTAELSAYNIFMKYNLLYYLIGLGIKEDNLQPPPDTDTLTYTFQRSGANFQVVITSTTELENWYILFFITAPRPATVNFIGTRPKYIHNGSNASQTVNLTSYYSAIYNYTPQVGDLLAVNVVLIGESSPKVLAADSDIYTVEAP